ncbi:MAG: HEAT repeat domain-containing protein [Acidimicrobiia bacterium]
MGLSLVTIILAAATVVASIALLSVKLAHRIMLRGRGVRSAHYIAALGEMISRQLLLARFPIQWAKDPLFHDAVIEYRHLLSGEEGEFVDRLVAEVGIVPVLQRRAVRRWPRPVRLRAIAALVELAGSDQGPLLRSLLADRNDYVRSHAAHGLARLGDIISIPLILDLATRVRPWEAARLADALAAFDRRAVQPINEWILKNWNGGEGQVETIAQAARVLGLLGETSAETTLIEMLESDRLEWKVAAASALGRIASDTSRGALLKALRDDSWEVRARAVRAIASLADGSVAPAISELLSDSQWWVRQNAAESLGELPGGVAELLKALSSDDRFAADAARNQLAELRLLPPGTEPTLAVGSRDGTS